MHHLFHRIGAFIGIQSWLLYSCAFRTTVQSNQTRVIHLQRLDEWDRANGNDCSRVDLLFISESQQSAERGKQQPDNKLPYLLVAPVVMMLDVLGIDRVLE